MVSFLHKKYDSKKGETIKKWKSDTLFWYIRGYQGLTERTRENEKKMEIMDDSICSICYDRYNDAEQSSRGKKKNIYGEFQNDTM